MKQGPHKFHSQYESNRGLHLVVDFNGDFGTVIECNKPSRYPIGYQCAFNSNPLLWKPYSVHEDYVPTQEGDRESDI